MSFSSRERILQVLSGCLPDRVPVCPFVQDEYLTFYYPEKSTVDRVYDALQLAKELDFDLIAKPRTFEVPHFLRKSFPNWDIKEDREVKDDKIYVRKIIQTPQKELIQVQIGPDVGAASAGIHLSTHEYFLKTPEDIEVFLKFLPPIDSETIDTMKTITAQWRQALGEYGIAAPWGWCGVFNMATEYRSIESLMMDTFDIPDVYRALMEKLADQMAIYNSHLARTDVECVGVQGNIANGSVFSSEYFAEHIEPYEKKVINAIHEQDTFTVYHNCGAASKLYPNYKRMGFTVWETVSEASFGDNTLKQAKEFFRNSMCLLGNLDQVHFLKTASAQEVRERTQTIVQTGKPGGHYIFSTSDFLEKNTSLQNIKTMIDTAKEIGVY